MKRALLILAVCAGFFTSSRAQVTSITVEEYYTDNGSVAGYPEGHTTYRIYANTTNSADKVTTVSGTALNPLALSVTGSGIWNYGPSGVTGDAVACTSFGLLPLAEYDSFVTIGVNCDNDGSINQMTVLEDGNQPWKEQSFDTAPYGLGQVIVNSTIGGAWFVLTDNPNATAGSDLKILLAQITTDGDICGTFYLQEFAAGSAASYNTFSFSSNLDGCIAGCNQPTAINYNDQADYNDGSCLFPCSIGLNAEVTPIACYGDLAEVIVSADSSQALYFFDNNTLSPDGDYQTFQLAPGEYTYIVRDTRFDNPTINPNGLTCADTLTITVEGVDSLYIGESATTDVTCFGDSNGTVSITNFGGGTAPLTFYLYLSENDSISLASPSYAGLEVGTYFFSVIDANGCSAIGSDFVIGSPNPITINSGTIEADCYNSIDINVTLGYAGGVGDVNFTLDENGPFDIEGVNSFVQVVADSIGIFTIYASDSLNCTAQTEFEVVGAPAISIIGDVTPVQCFGLGNGELSVNASGGAGSFTYSFDGGASFSSLDSINGLSASTVDVIVRDANGCESTASFQIDQPEELSAVGSATSVACLGDENGSIQVVIEGGTFPYLIALDEQPTVVDVASQFTGLAPGGYIIYVTDGNNCSFVASEPTVVTEPDSITTSVSVTDINCFGETGSILVTASGGTAPFQFSFNGSPLSSNNQQSNALAGDYAITVVDDRNCVASATASVEGPSAALSIDGLSAVAGGSSEYNVIGGTEPYSYSWTGPNGFSSVAEALEGMNSLQQSGDYTLTVTDANGCEAFQTIIIIGLNEVNTLYQIQLYPNPNNGQFTLNMQGLTGETVSYSVLDNSGRVVVAKDLGSVGTARLESVDMVGAAAGIYQLRISVNGQTQSTRFVKQ
jgi:hypothetical protein